MVCAEGYGWKDQAQEGFRPSCSNLPKVKGDPARLREVFENLIENAIKYTPEGKSVWVRLNTLPDRVIFEVQDNGIGISTVDIPRLFEKFYRSANREAKKERGTGLGLAIVKSIADRHKGRVWVESKLGSGSTFFFEFPIKQSKADNDISLTG